MKNFQEDDRDALEEPNVVMLPQFHSKDQVTRGRDVRAGQTAMMAQNRLEDHCPEEKESIPAQGHNPIEN